MEKIVFGHTQAASLKPACSLSPNFIPLLSCCALTLTGGCWLVYKEKNKKRKVVMVTCLPRST